MSPATELPAQRIRAALEALRHTQGLLLEPTPRNIDICCTALAAAARHLEPLLAEPANPHRNLPQLVAVLHNEVSVIAKLLDHAASYHANLLQKMIEASHAHAPVATGSGTNRLQVDA